MISTKSFVCFDSSKQPQKPWLPLHALSFLKEEFSPVSQSYIFLYNKMDAHADFVMIFDGVIVRAGESQTGL